MPVTVLGAEYTAGKKTTTLALMELPVKWSAREACPFLMLG